MALAQPFWPWRSRAMRSWYASRICSTDSPRALASFCTCPVRTESITAYTGAPDRISHVYGLDPFRAAALPSTSTVSNPSLSVSGPRRPRAKATHGRHGSACFEAAGSHPRRRDDSPPRKGARDTPAPVLSEHPSPVIDPYSTRNRALPARLAAPRLRTWFQMA